MRLKHKIVVIGHAEHGKDTACEYLHDKFEITFRTTSFTACELFIYKELKNKHGYKTIEECFIDRRNHRCLWGEMISNYTTKHGKTVIIEKIFEDSDICCGIRKMDELFPLKQKGLVDTIIWVDASDRMPLESPKSMDIPVTAANIVISNNGTKDELYSKLDKLGELLISLH